MDLRELRISLGLTQLECANYLKMSLRNYQNYENNITKNIAKKNALFKKLEQYNNKASQEKEYYTNIITGNDLKMLCMSVKNYKKRDCFKSLKSFIDNDLSGKICILYGLRRTGKTTLIFQLLNELPYEESAYIKVQTKDSMSSLTKDLKELFKKGYKYVCIDEITLLNDFIDTAAVLSDVFSMMGMKIVVSGKDSLGFALSSRDELYDRNIMIHTSYISFKEYFKVLNINSIDKYIEYGGTLKIENMNFDDPEFTLDDISFRDDETTRKYIDTAISKNIQHSLKNDKDGMYFNQLRTLYDNNELTNVINRIVESMNHEFLVRIIEEEFKSHDLGSAKNLLLHDAPEDRAYVLENIDKEKVTTILKSLVEIKETYETKVHVTQEHIDKVKSYLKVLDLIVNIPVRYESGSRDEYYVFTQPGMRYSLVKALVYSLMKDSYFSQIPETDKKYIIEKISTDVKGRMMEDIVLLEVSKSINKNKEAFKLKFDLGGEIDMIIYDRETNTNKIFEIKHSEKASRHQTRHLIDQNKCQYIEKIYGKTIGKYVIYRGENKIIDGIEYLNVEEYLCTL